MVEGTVYDQDVNGGYQAVAGVYLEVTGADGQSTWVTTGATGSYSATVPPGPCRVRPTPPDGRAFQVSEITAEVDRPLSDLHFVLVTHVLTVWARVMGKPAYPLDVRVANQTVMFIVKMREDGSATAVVPPGDYTVDADQFVDTHGQTHAFPIQTVNVNGMDDVVVFDVGTAATGFVVSGHVLDAGRQPVAGAEVRAYSLTGELVGRVTTDFLGEYELTLDENTYDLTAVDPRGVEAPRRRQAVNRPVGGIDFVVQ